MRSVKASLSTFETHGGSSGVARENARLRALPNSRFPCFRLAVATLSRVDGSAPRVLGPLEGSMLHGEGFRLNQWAHGAPTRSDEFVRGQVRNRCMWALLYVIGVSIHTFSASPFSVSLRQQQIPLSFPQR